MKISTKELVISGLLVALAVILSFPMFKIMGSIGFDAMPAFFGAAALGPVLGGLIGGVAHMVTAIMTGTPFTLPVHLVVTVMMFASCYLYGYARKVSNRYIAMVVGIGMNAPVTLLVSAFTAQFLGAPFSGIPMFMALILPLSLAAAVNVILADVVYGLVRPQFAKLVKA